VRGRGGLGTGHGAGAEVADQIKQANKFT
jgi:hypothetical protein